MFPFVKKLFPFIPLLLFPLLIRADVVISNPLTSTSVEGIVSGLSNFVLKVGLAVAPVMIIVAGFFYITAQGDPEKIKKANNIIFWTIVGLGVILLSKGIVAIIKELLKVKSS